MQGVIPGITVTCGKAHEAGGQVVLVDEGRELASQVRSVAQSLIPVANNSLSYKSGEVVIILPADTFHSNCDISSRESVITDSDFGADEVWLCLLSSSNLGRGSAVWLSWEAREVLLSKLNQLSVRDTTSTDENHTVSGIVGLDVVDQVIALDALDVFGRTKDSASQRLALEGSCMEVVKDNFLQLLVDLFGFSKDNVTLTLNGLRFKLGVLEDIGEDVNGLEDI